MLRKQAATWRCIARCEQLAAACGEHQVVPGGACTLSPQIASVRQRSDLGAVGVAISRFEASAAIHDTDFGAEAPRLFACPGNDALLVLGAVYTPTGVRKVNVPLRTSAYDLKCFHVLGLVMALALVYWQKRVLLYRIPSRSASKPCVRIPTVGWEIIRQCLVRFVPVAGQFGTTVRAVALGMPRAPRVLNVRDRTVARSSIA